MLTQLSIENSRYTNLADQFQKEYFHNIESVLKKHIQASKDIYPPIEKIRKAFELCTRNNTKVVILGQDPYHKQGQAHGLSFSVPEGIAIPPSLANIYKELQQEYPEQSFKQNNGDLTSWASQGVLLLNSFLTVQAGKPLSHSKIGWETFTDHVITTLSAKKNNLVFMLWGSYAQSKCKLIDNQKHLILKAAHPSPLSAYKGRFGCDHFRLCNNYLKKNNQKPIKWIS